MNNTPENMVKLAEELVDRLAVVEKENAALKEQCKLASAAAAPKPAPCVSDSVAQKSCDELVKAGAITQEQVAQTKQAFLTDPEAAHKALCGLLQQLPQIKSAAVEQSNRLYGGTLVNAPASKADVWDELADRMARTLNMPI